MAVKIKKAAKKRLEKNKASKKQSWGSPVEQEIKRRMKLSIAAYAYEYDSTSIMSDGDYDKECLKVDLKINTGNEKLDKFFKKHFDPDTGLWIRKHPELDKVKFMYEKYYK